MPSEVELMRTRAAARQRAEAIEAALREVVDETAFYQARFNSKEWRAKARAALAQ